MAIAEALSKARVSSIKIVLDFNGNKSFQTYFNYIFTNIQYI